ncbi:MAG: putative transposase [Steroidobacteraceae bacterium]
MNDQLALGLPVAPPSDIVVINARCTLRTEGEQRVVVVGGLPVYHYCAADAVAEAYAMVMLVESGFAQQTEVARAFSKSERSVRRYQERYVQAGMAGLGRPGGWRHGRRRISGKRLRLIERLKGAGLSTRAIGQRLGVSAMAIRKLLGPSKGEEADQLALMSVPKAPSIEPPLLPSVSDTPIGSLVAQAEAANDLAQESTVLEEEDEPVPMTLDADASDRSLDRQLAHAGLLDDAVPMFRDGQRVPGAGVLLAVPYLVHSGLLRIARKLYGGIGPAFYGLRTTLATLFLMALLRIQRPEQLKERDPAALGRLLGLDRAPEVKTLRRGLGRLAAQHCAEQLGAELARVRVAQRGELMGFLYIDGHVRAYHGKRTISKAYVARRHLAAPATTDYWINDRAGDPLLLITAELDPSLAKAFPQLLKEVRAAVGTRQVTIVFDRGGWSPKLFRSMIEQGFDLLTYRKGKSRRIHERRFVRRRAKLDGRWVNYDLHDQPVRLLKGRLRLRQITRLCEDGGHQTQIVTSRWDLRDIEVAYRMFERWRQENYFKYMREEFLLDALVDYRIEPQDPTRTVPNPERRALDKQIRAARTELADLERQYGAAAADNPEHHRPTMRGFKIAHGRLGQQLRAARERLRKLLDQRRRRPARVEIRDLGEQTLVKLATERKHLTDLIKMLAYQAESDLFNLLSQHYLRAEQEGRTLLHELFAASGDIHVTDEQLQITLAPLSSPHRTRAVQVLCELLDQTATPFPGTRLRMRFAVPSPPRIGLAFPGTPAHRGATSTP